MRVLFRHYTSYGKRDNECLESQWVEDDTPEARENIIEEYSWADWNEDRESFINGKINKISYWVSGDWDSPTGGVFVVFTKEMALSEIEETYKEDKETINRLFEEEE